MLKGILIIILLFIGACDRNDEVTGTVDETHTVIALEGYVYTSVGSGASDVSVHIPNTGFSTATDSNGFYSLKISVDSLNQLYGGIDSVEQKLFFSNQTSLLDSLILESWVGTVPQVILTQRNISGSLVGDISQISKIFMYVTTNASDPISVELWLNDLTKEYSGFWYNSKINSADSIRLYISVVDENGFVLSKSPELVVNHLAGDIGFPVIVIGSKPHVFDVQIKGNFMVGSVMRGEYSYLDAEGNEEEGTQYQWHKNDEPIIGAVAIEYICQPEDSGTYLSFEVTPITTVGFFLVGEPTIVTSSLPINSTTKPQITNISIIGEAFQGGLLTATYDYLHHNGDQELKSVYQWYRSSVKNIDGNIVEDGEREAIAGAMDTTYTIDYLDSGKVLYFEVTPVSESNIGVVDTGRAFNSSHFGNSVTVTGWNVPEIHDLNIIKKRDTLSVQYSYLDIDGDSAGVSLFQWYRNDTLIVGANKSKYLLTTLDSNATLRVTVAPVALTGINLIGEPQSTSIPYFGWHTDERDGQIYKTVILGGYTWMAENLNYSGDNGEGRGVDSVGYCYGSETNNNHESNSFCSTYGRLYTYFDATGYSDSIEIFTPSPNTPVQGLCPEGWHIALQKEWHDLWYMIEESNQSHSALLKGSELWTDELVTSNLLGFTALPAGISFNSPDSLLTYTDQRTSQFEGAYASWWAGSEVVSYTNPITGSWNRWGGFLIFSLTNSFNGFSEYETPGANRNVARSIRCVKNHSF